MASPLRRERHSVTDLKIHLVCVTKYRRAVFTGESLDLIEKTFREVAEKMNFKPTFRTSFCHTRIFP